MATTGSSVLKSPSRLPALSKKSAGSALASPSKVPLPKTPSTSSQSSRRTPSPSKLPKSPGLRPVSSGAAELSKATSSGKSIPPPAPKGSKAVSTGIAASSKRTSPPPTTGSSPRTPSPKITVPPSPPSAPEPSAAKVTSKPIQSAKPISRITKPLELVPEEKSPYIAAHLGDPCTLKSLDHVLECGNKVITTQPESCASNCKGSFSPLVNPRSLDQRFVCLSCIVSDQQTKHAERVKSFKEELQQVAKATKKEDADEWIEAKVRFMEKAWKDVAHDEMIAAAKEGRFAYPVYVDPENESVMVAVVSERLSEKGREQVEAAKEAVRDEKGGM